MFYFSASDAPAWLTIERTTTSGLPLQSYRDAPKLPQFAPIWGNENFGPGRADGGLKQWANRGLCTIIDLYMDENLMTFDQLVCKYD